MKLTSGLRRGQALRLALAAGLVLVVAATGASRAQATTSNLSGFWVVKTDTRGGYTLRESKDGSVLNADWGGLPPHQALQGHFKGALDVEGDAYLGTFTVTEGAVSTSGNGSFALNSSFFASFPTIDVTLTPTSVSGGGYGGTSTFTLELFAATPQYLAPDGVTEEITNPSQEPVSGVVTMGIPQGSAMSLGVGGVVRSATPKKKPTLGQTRFALPPGQSRKVSVSLNKRGRKLLKQRRSLSVQVVVRLKAASGTSTVIKAGVVTFKK